MDAKRAIAVLVMVFVATLGTRAFTQSQIGKEVSVAVRLADGDEFTISLETAAALGVSARIHTELRRRPASMPSTTACASALIP